MRLNKSLCFITELIVNILESYEYESNRLTLANMYLGIFVYVVGIFLVCGELFRTLQC